MFGPGGSVLVSDVQCNGTEDELHLCPNIENSRDNDNCGSSSAGVICLRSFGL